MEIVDIIGYGASVLLIISFMLKDIRMIRMINGIGCACFVAYGILLGWDKPIIITNLFIIGVHLFHLIKANPATGNQQV